MKATMVQSNDDDHYYTMNDNDLKFYSYNDSLQRPGPGDIADSSFWSAFGTGGYADEPPLLDELGIHLGAIKAKSLEVLMNRPPPTKVDDDDDLAGPLLFLLLFGASLLLRGKVEFESIYGVNLLGVLSIFCVLNLMSPVGIGWSRTASVLGYSLLPILLLSGVGILLPLSGVLGLLLAAGAIVWCVVISSTAFSKTLWMDEQRFLVAYPIGLFYTCFALMTVY